MAQPASELTSESVRSRIADWKERLAGLYSRFEDAARRAPALRVERIPIRGRTERPMERHGVPAPELEELVVTGAGGRIKLVPLALWVIGANGRVDLIATDRNGRMSASILADVSEPGAEAANWQLYEPGARSSGVVLEDGLIEEIVARVR